MITKKGFIGMFLGYPKDHAENTYLMWNVNTKRTVIARTVSWLNESYGETKKLKKEDICRLPFPKYEDEDNGDYELLHIGGIEQNLNKNKKSPEKYKVGESSEIEIVEETEN